MQEKGYVSPQDDAFFLVTDDVDRACEELFGFYRRYHSSRYVDRKRRLVLRLKEPISEKQIRALNEEFGDVLLEGKIETCGPFSEESDEPEVQELAAISHRWDLKRPPCLV